MGECYGALSPSGSCGESQSDYFGKSRPDKKLAHKKKKPEPPKKKATPAKKKKTTWTTASGSKAKRMPNGKIKYTQPSGSCGVSGRCGS